MKNLALSDDYNDTTDKSVDLLIGLDFYFNFVNGKVCRGAPSCPVAGGCILGWILCGPIGSCKIKRQENVNLISSATMGIETKTIEQNLKEELNKFWKTENMEIGEAKSVYDDFESTIQFGGSR